jgi:hypothetical protein
MANTTRAARLRLRAFTPAWLTLGLVGAAACQDSTAVTIIDSPDPVVIDPQPVVPVDGDGTREFASDLPPGGLVNRFAPGLSPAAESVASNAGGAADASRAIAEADILQLDGDRLYALSRYSGLSVVNLSDPAAIRLEGTYRSAAEPFEMYVQDGIVFAMFNNWQSFECDADGYCQWQQTSRMQAINARDPAHIQLLSDYEVPGAIQDSRRVGDVLYLATQEYGHCYNCDVSPNTTITAFNAADLTALRQVDQLRLPAQEDAYVGSRSIMVTDKRLYISGWEWAFDRNVQSGSIQVVDISDPQGALVKGASVDIAGQIQNRWQMDEYEGVLRVVSQPGGFASGLPMELETFAVSSASEVTKLAGISVVLPGNRETLRSARFDGDRAYAITAEQTDPLFTFDLSDPANPRQLGELEMPGWVYHIEPRGDRLFAVGFDQRDAAGALNVSLFDVSNLEAPTLLGRIGFGGNWGNFAEDQDRIHKAFSILEEKGLILVPFSGVRSNPETCASVHTSGIQLLDFTRDTLTQRGVAPQVGEARRAFLHRDRLFGVGDNAVQSFDITNRDAPVATGQLEVARNVTTVRVLGDHLMRFGSEWWTGQTALDVTPLSQAGNAQPEAEIDLASAFGADAWSCNGSANWSGEVFVKGNFAYVPRYTYTYSLGATQQRITFYVIDMSDRAAPRVVNSFALESLGDNSYFAGITQTENSLLVGRSRGSYTWNDQGEVITRPTYRYDVVDLSAPEAPRFAAQLELPEAIAGGGWGHFMGGCTVDLPWGWGGYRGYYGGYYGTQSVALTDGDLVVSQHAEAIGGDSTQMRYYLDRIDVSNPDAPRVLPQVNIPGTAVHFNAETGEIVTVDYERTVEPTDATPENVYNDCDRGAYGWFNTEIGACEVFRRSVSSLVLEGDQAVRRSLLPLDRTRRVGGIAVSDNRLFYTTLAFPSRTPPQTNESGAVTRMPTTDVTLERLTLNDGVLAQLPAVPLRTEATFGWYSGQLLARGERVFEIANNTVTVVDASLSHAARQIKHEIPGWGCGALEATQSAAYCALGQRGVEVIDLTSMR